MNASSLDKAKDWIIDPVPGKTHPIKDGCWVKVISHIRLNATGEVRQYEMSEIKDDDSPIPSTFIWAEGNYACDCNRYLFFERAGGQQPDLDAECGEGKYAVNLANAKNGEVYYREFE